MFDVKKALIKVQGGKEYLPVASRLVWFREEHPDWAIVTEPVMRAIASFKNPPAPIPPPPTQPGPAPKPVTPAKPK